MIQRIQTVYLILIVTIAFALQYPDVLLVKGQFTPANGTPYAFSLSFTGLTLSSEVTEQMSLGNTRYAYAITGIIALVSVFMFKRLPVQLRMVSFNLLFILLALFYTAFNLYKLNNIEHTEVTHISIQWGAMLPALMLVFNILAIRGIRKDIELLASADRLR